MPLGSNTSRSSSTPSAAQRARRAPRPGGPRRRPASARRGAPRERRRRTAASCSGVSSSVTGQHSLWSGLVRRWDGRMGDGGGPRGASVVGTDGSGSGFPGSAWAGSPPGREHPERGRRAGPGRASSGTSPCRPRSRASRRRRRPGSPPCRPAPARRAARRAAPRGRRAPAGGVRRPPRGRPGRWWTRSGSSADPRSPYSSRSSGSGSARRTFAARSRSRQALTTTRCSQVVTAASPRNDAGPPERRDHAVLQAVGGVLGVAHGAQGHRPEPVAVPAEQDAERVRVAVDVGLQQLGVGGLVALDAVERWSSGAKHRHVDDLAAEAGRRRCGQRGEPEHEVAAGRGAVERDHAVRRACWSAAVRPSTPVGGSSVRKSGEPVPSPARSSSSAPTSRLSRGRGADRRRT